MTLSLLNENGSRLLSQDVYLWHNPNFKTRKTLGRSGWYSREGKTITKHMPALFPEMPEINELWGCDRQIMKSLWAKESQLFLKACVRIVFLNFETFESETLGSECQ